ncbi:hypothetical protein MPER_09108, partial [Moniliophthora perniciosa FA553]
GKASQYTYENVCIVPGGRSGLSRVAAVIGDVYTCRQQKILLDIDQVRKDIVTQGLAVILASNPRNPTGQVGASKTSRRATSSRNSFTLVFYSWYIYPENDKDYGKSVSSAEYIEDVNEDAVVIVDGLTKVPRSFLDGGANHPLQLAAIPLLDPARVFEEKVALQKHFKKKRDHVLKRLHDLSLDVDVPPSSTFYIWLNLERLPAPLNNGLTFFEELLKEQTIVIPGIFFDINPSHRRNLFNSPCHHFVRLSFGPPLEDLDKGLDAMARVLKKAKKEGMKAFGH